VFVVFLVFYEIQRQLHDQSLLFVIQYSGQ